MPVIINSTLIKRCQTNTNMTHWYSLFGALQVKNDQLSVGNLKEWKFQWYDSILHDHDYQIFIQKYFPKATYVYKTHILKLLSPYSLQKLFLQHKQPPGKCKNSLCAPTFLKIFILRGNFYCNYVNSKHKLSCYLVLSEN